MIERLRIIFAFRFIFDAISTMASIVFVLLFSHYKSSRSLPRLRSKCIVLGNGPSLRNALKDLHQFISSCDVVVTNDFPVTPEFLSIKPQYYYIIDGAFFEVSDSQVIFPRTLSICRALQAVDWDINVFVPRKHKNLLESQITNSKVKFYYFNLTPCDGFEAICFVLYKYGLALPYANNVLIPVLIHALNSGYSDISIYGAEHNWTSFFTLDDENRLCMAGQHYFSETIEKPKVWWKSKDVSLLVHEALYALSLTFRAYHAIAKYAKKRNVVIYNCTDNSLIDAFPKFLINKY